MTTNDTSGPLFTNSSPSADLQRSLENRLRANLEGSGSPEYALTWKMHDMPSGPPICALRASGRRTSGKDFSGWPSPQTRDHHAQGANHNPKAHSSSLATVVEKKAPPVGWPTPNVADDNNSRAKDPQAYSQKRIRGGYSNLATTAQALVTGWPTPTKGNADGSQMAKDASTTGKRPDGSKATVSLNQVAQTAGWPTPMAGTPAQNGNNAAGNNDSSRKTVELVSGWATPTTRDHKDGASTLDNTPINSLLGRQATLSPAPTESGDESPPTKRASLNPAFSLWLMGYPTEWAHCAARVTRSSRKSRQSS
jgi:hypothetical protein